MLTRIAARFNAAGWLCAAFWLMLFLPARTASAADRPGDEFLAGYITSILEQDLRWEADSYRLKVSGGAAAITLLKDDPARRETAEKRLRGINGLEEVAIIAAPAADGKQEAESNFPVSSGEGEAFPPGNLFLPLLADPKQPQFFISFYRFSSSGARYSVAGVGFGETFGLYRFPGSREGDGLQLSVEAGLFAQFNMSTPSYDLINADYTVGIPAAYRHGDNSIRLRIYHQSSHLGDELLLSANPPRRVNLTLETVELIYSRQWRGWRAYGGGEYLLAKEPNDLKRRSAHWGIEYRGEKPLVRHGKLVGGADMKALEEHNWATDVSVKIGLEFGRPNPGQRRLRLMAEWYKGFDQRGQFYINKVEYYGLGVSLGF